MPATFVGPCCCGSGSTGTESSGTESSISSGSCCASCLDMVIATLDIPCLGLEGVETSDLCSNISSNHTWSLVTADQCPVQERTGLSFGITCEHQMWFGSFALSQAGPCTKDGDLTLVSASCEPLEVVFEFDIPEECCPCESGGGGTGRITLTL